MADHVMSILHMGEKQFTDGSLWSSATAKRKLTISPSQKIKAAQKKTLGAKDESTHYTGFGTRLRGFKPRPTQAPVTTRNLDHMPSVLMQAALQAAMAWESGQQLFQQGHSEESLAPLLPENKPAGDDVKQLIASNLETVHWAHNRSKPTAAERADDLEDEKVVEHDGGRRPGAVLPPTWLEATGQPRSGKPAKSASRLRRMLDMLKTWPDTGIPISLDAMPPEVAGIVTGKAASAAAFLGMEGTNVSTIGVGTAAVMGEGVSNETLTDAICGQVGYPFDLVVPGMLAHNMLEFTVDTNSGEVRLKLMNDWHRAAGLNDPSDPKAHKGMHQDFMEMLLRAYDSFGRDVFGSSSESEDSDGCSSVGGGSGGWTDLGDDPSTSARRRPHALQPQAHPAQPGVVSNLLRAPAGRPVGCQGGGSTKESLPGTEAGAASQQGSDATLLGWATRGTAAGSTEAALRNADSMQRGARRSVMDASSLRAAPHRVAGGGLASVDLCGADGMSLRVDLSDAQNVLELPPWDPALAGPAGIRVYIVPDGAGRLLRFVDGGPQRGLLQVADVTAVVEEVTLVMQGALKPADPAPAQLLFTQHLSATERALTQDAVHRYIRSMGLQTVQELLAALKLGSSPHDTAGGLELGPLSTDAQRAAHAAQRGGGRRDAQRRVGSRKGTGALASDGSTGDEPEDSIQAMRSVRVLGGVAMAMTRLSQVRLRAADPDQWRVPGTAVDYFVPPGGLEGATDLNGEIRRDLDPGARRFHVPAVHGELGPGGRALAGEDSTDQLPPFRDGGSWRVSGAGTGQFSSVALGPQAAATDASRVSRLAPWRAGQAHARAVSGEGDSSSGLLYRPSDSHRGPRGPAWRPSGFAPSGPVADSLMKAGLSAADIDRIKKYGWNRSVEWQEAHAVCTLASLIQHQARMRPPQPTVTARVQEVARARSARRQQWTQERAKPPQPHEAPEVNYDDVAQHMGALMQLYRSEALDTLRACGGERRLWEAATQNFAHAAQLDPRTGEALLRVADSRTARSTHLLQALHVAAGATAWQPHEMPTVGLPAALVPAIDFRCHERPGAQQAAECAQAQPEFMVGGHEAVEVMMHEPHAAGKLVVASPDVASHVVHAHSGPPPQAQRQQPPRAVRSAGRRAWPAHQPLIATDTRTALPFDGDALEGQAVGQAAMAHLQAEDSLMCDADPLEGATADINSGDQHVENANKSQCKVSASSVRAGDAAVGETDDSFVVCDSMHSTPQGRGGTRQRKRRAASPPVLKVGIAQEVHDHPQAQQLQPQSELVQAALKAKVADRVLLNDLDAKFPA